VASLGFAPRSVARLLARTVIVCYTKTPLAVRL